ncbi:MAG: DNA/RNA non-specific endonuclease [Parvicellaceae bacterium]
MTRIKLHIIILNMLSSFILFGQNDNQIEKINLRIKQIKKEEDSLNKILEELILKKNLKEICSTILPENDLKFIKHSTIVISYNEEHEQANWVAHKINNKIINGNVSRTNDFRTDKMILTGSSEEADYFLKTKLSSGKYKYDGYGYDRGHLAPSADFKWSEKALSESYFYSNMSPQLPEFNREGWARIEDFLRTYIYSKNVDLLVITGPTYNSKVRKQSRSKNNISIPDYFFKIAIDLTNEEGIGFYVPHKKLEKPIESYILNIDSIEKITDYNFNYQLNSEIEKKIESQLNLKFWQSDKTKGNVAPISINKLPKNSFNTFQAKGFVDTKKKVVICGKVVSTKLTKSGHTFLNLDQAFPNQIFSATIWESNSLNFSFPPHQELKNKNVCLKGYLTENKGTPTMDLKNEKNITYINP